MHGVECKHSAYMRSEPVWKFVNFLLLFYDAGAQHGVNGRVLAQHAALRRWLAHRAATSNGFEQSTGPAAFIDTEHSDSEN